MAHRQVRLSPDVSRWVEECAEDWSANGEYCSLSSAANRLLRALRDEPVVAPVAVEPPAPAPAQPRPPTSPSTRQRSRRRAAASPTASRIAAILQQNAQQ